MVHSFLTRIFSLLNTVKNNSTTGIVGAVNVNNASGVSLASIVIEASVKSPSTITTQSSISSIDSEEVESLDSSQVGITTNVTKITKKDFEQDDDDDESPSFFLTTENNNNNTNKINSSDNNNCMNNNVNKNNRNLNRWSSSCNWTWCKKPNNATNSFKECNVNEDYEPEEEEDETYVKSMTDLEQQSCIDSKKLKMSSDNNNNNHNNVNNKIQRRRRLWFLIVIGLIITLILAIISTMTILILMSSSLSSSLLSLSDINNNSSNNYNHTFFESDDETFTYSSNSSESTAESDESLSFSTEQPLLSSTNGKEVTYSTIKTKDFDAEAKLKELERKRRISRLSWDLINKRTRHHHRTSSSSSSSQFSINGNLKLINNNNNNNKNTSDKNIFQLRKYNSNNNKDDDDNDDEVSELILPAKMVYTSSDYHLRRAHQTPDNQENLEPISTTKNNVDKNKSRSCCKTQKYSQIIKHDGCESITIVNRMCIGQCVSVWVPGLFASFPVCKPSKSVWRTFKLKCGPNGSQVQRVRVERVKRCSCMQIESNSNNNNNNNSSSNEEEEDKR